MRTQTNITYLSVTTINRLAREFNVPVHTGLVYVHYREGITDTAQVTHDYDRVLASGKRLYAGLDITVTPLDSYSSNCYIELEDTVDAVLSAQQCDDLITCLQDACAR
jgi:translation elongation factor EF-G